MIPVFFAIHLRPSSHISRSYPSERLEALATASSPGQDLALCTAENFFIIAHQAA